MISTVVNIVLNGYDFKQPIFAFTASLCDRWANGCCFWTETK